MGDIADQIINGEACELCVMPFKNGYEHGYPVVCKDCWEGLTEEEKKMHQRALVNTI
jgi:hypothetical protein